MQVNSGHLTLEKMLKIIYSSDTGNENGKKRANEKDLSQEQKINRRENK